MDPQRIKRAFARAMEEPSGERACVAALLDHYGVDSDGIHVCGESMLDLYEALSDAGLDVRGYEGTLSGLRILEAPGILHWEDEEDGKGRFVVYYGFRSGKYVIGDPKRGVRRVGPPDLARHWMSRMLLYADGMAKRASARAGAERYRCFDVEAVGLGSDRVLIRSRRTDTARVLPAAEAEQLFRADRFRSMAVHERRIRRNYAGGVAGAADSGTWRGWVEDGMLTTESAVREEVACYGVGGATLSDRREGISAIGIPTRNRAGSVLAALRCYHANVSMHGRRVRFVVADSSSIPDQVRLASALDVLRNNADIEVDHLNETWRANLIRTLADETGCSPDVLRFALYGHETCGTNYGANRNALLLATAGELSVHVDDDTRLPLFEGPDTRSGIALSSKADPNEYWFGACDWEPAAEASFIEVHETLLGHPVARLLKESDRGDIAIDDLEPQLLQRLPEAGIGLSFIGHTGDAGTSSNVSRLFLEGASLGRLVRRGYAEGMRTRETGRIVARRTIGNGLFCLGMNVGVDNRQTLPPFMPAGRNEDGVFSATLEAVFPLLLRGFCEGYAIGHRPPRERAPFPAEIDFDGFRINDILTALIGEWGASQPDRFPRRLRDLGDRLAAYGSLDQHDFDLACRTAVERSTGMLMLHIEHALSGPAGSIPPMRADLARLADTLERFVTHPECNAPVDLTGDAAERRSHLRDLVGAYGTLVQHWSDIVLCARQVRMDEVGVA